MTKYMKKKNWVMSHSMKDTFRKNIFLTVNYFFKKSMFCGKAKCV